MPQDRRGVGSRRPSRGDGDPSHDRIVRGPATAAFDEHHLGSLRAGYLADFVVLSDDILSIDAARIGEVKVDMTVVGGRVVYERE